MENFIRAQVTKRLKAKFDQSTDEIHIISTTNSVADFVSRRLEQLPIRVHTHAHVQRVNAQTGKYFQFKCVRAGKKRATKSVKPVACPAYVSYKAMDFGQYTAIVERKKLQHIGHDPQSQEDKRLHKIDEELESLVCSYLEMGVKPDVILTLTYQWAQDRGHADVNDRQFYLTPTDISEIRRKVMSANHLGRDDTVSVEELTKNDFKDSTVFYQPINHAVDQPLIIVLQTHFMRKKMMECGRSVLFMDATNSVTQYGYPLFAICARDEAGYGVPVAFIITSSEQEDVLVTALRSLRKETQFYPRAFIVDKDYAEINALAEVYPESKVLMCWFHVLQAVYRWMIRKESGIAGEENKVIRSEVISMMTKLKNQSKEDNFKEKASQLMDKFKKYPKLQRYIEENWISISDMWADYGRPFYHEDAKTNNLCERFFLRLKHQFLNMTLNRRLDDLIRLLLLRVMSYFMIKSRLQEDGRLPSKRDKSSSVTAAAAERLISKGWTEKVKGHIHQRGTYVMVPSEKTLGLTYKVVPSEMYCECQHNRNGGHICKHLRLCFILSRSAESFVRDVETLTAEAIQHIIDSKSYDILDNALGEVKVKSPHSGEEYLVRSISGICTCTAYAHQGSCLCLRVAKMVCTDVIVHEEELNQEMIQPADAPQLDPCPSRDVETEVNNPRELCIQQLSQMLEFVNNTGNFLSTTSVTAIKQAHLSMFSNYKKKTKKKKNTPLFPNRGKGASNKSTSSAKIITKGKRKSMSRKQINGSNPEKFQKITNSNKLPKRPRQRPMKEALKSVMLVKLPLSDVELTQEAYDYVVMQKKKTNIPKKLGIRKSFLKTIADNLQQKYCIQLDSDTICNALQSFFAPTD
ncbi:uncharacterized protein [Amphiura filiformis]|uniref:uncharacterized protein n=1 Tax=Amphiura filiformis TaxID=82378 RepID=UPI003B2219A0